MPGGLFPMLLFMISESAARRPPDGHPLRQHVHHSTLSPPPKQPESILLDELMRGYDKRIRPGMARGIPVTIHMTIVLAILTELRENQQVASIVISHVQRWRDEGLTWDPLHHNGTTQLIMPFSLIWAPKLVIYNSMDTKQMLTQDRYDIRVQHTGDVKVNNPEYVTIICRLNIDLFPFDTQFCAIAFASPLLNEQEMTVNVSAPPRDSYFAGNAEWEVMNVTVRQLNFLEDGEYRVEVHYILHLNRRPIYYVTVIVVPTFLISALSILGIFSPGSNDGPRNEKVSLGLGSLLAMTVLLDIVAGAMPKSNSIPLLGYYIIAEIMICAIGVAISMALLSASRARIQTECMPSESTYRMLQLSVYKKLPNPFRGLPEASVPSERNGHSSLPFQQHLHTHSALCAHEAALVRSAGNVVKKESISNTLRIPEMAGILSHLLEVAQAQKSHRERLERIKWNGKVEREWNRIFARVDHILLLLFELINVATLLGFLRYAFLPVPPLPDDFSV